MRTWNQHQAKYRIKVCLPFGGRDKQTGYLDGYANCHKEDILKGYWESLTGISSKVGKASSMMCEYQGKNHFEEKGFKDLNLESYILSYLQSSVLWTLNSLSISVCASTSGIPWDKDINWSLSLIRATENSNSFVRK